MLWRTKLMITMLGIVLGLAGCTDVAIRPGLPSYMSKLAIPIFQNRTAQPNLENQLTQLVTQDFLMDGRLELSDADHADALLNGTITQYLQEPLLMDVHNTPQQYKLRLIMRLALKDTKAGKNLWTDESFEENTTYYVANTLGIPAETEQTARARVIDQIARRIVARVIEGF